MQVVRLLKNLCPMRILFGIKYLSSFMKQRQIDGKTTGKRIFYLDAPDYANIGDQAIALAIREFAKEQFPEYVFVEILQKDLASVICSLKKVITEEDIIFLTGGGNMGNIYKMYEATRRYVIKSFPKNKIVVFPQTIEYTDDIFGRRSAKASKKLYAHHKNLVLCAREEKSFQKMIALYPGTKVLLCPDIALSLNEVFEERQRASVALCLRDDCEAALTEKEKERIFRLLETENLCIKKVTTMSEKTTITDEVRKQVVTDKLREFASFRFMITDRLHAMVFCAVTKTPCIALRNSNGKVEGVYKWIENLSYISFANDICDVEKNIKQLLGDIPAEKESLRVDYSELIFAIKGDC